MGEVKNTKKDKVLFAVVILGLILALVFIFIIMPKMQERGASGVAAEETTEPSAEAPAVTTESPTASTPAPTPTETHTGDDAEFDFDDENAGFKATTDRKPKPEDANEAKKVLADTLPRWGGIDLSGNGIAPDSWAKKIARPGGIDPAFKAWSQTKFYDLWGGIIQMGASAEVRDVKIDKELWNVGSHSMWRVSITRSVINDDTGDEVMQETVSWDILVAQDDEDEDGFVLSYFAIPNKDNEKPETFYLPPLPNY